MQFRTVIQVLAISSIVALAGCSTTPLSTPSAGKPAPGSSASRSSTTPVLPPAGSGRGGYYKDDGPGENIPEGLENLPDAEPRVEPYANRGNKPYVVFGKKYVPIADERPFKQRGRGSWYGKKFHGQKTSSGEPYDMYQMTAAHPVLPIPSYARVTNLSNGKQVIVRVNDRGPFHSSRVIDLSYTAALKLGYIGHGSAELEVERLLPADIERINANKGATVVASDASPVQAPTVETVALAAPITPPATGNSAPAAATPLQSGFYLQFGAYAQMANAEAVRARVTQDVGSSLPQLKVEPSNNLYRLYSGPFASRDEAAAAALQVQQSGLNKPFVVQR
ncbi:septal ring lytic transglycosylase RlpA family protein [Herminiimonas sp. KBW02]|uniref:septal ring lytic transglycosylase RlpA family protein n=1 Tax=Herminiimonas sp. KBW02 TaxID=2153363 RepID=UPI000F5A08FA|nr:septal ring lytic transglycosylase RlpA family protein [Herminiimonas sp. KBW02]RQO37406.1 septal ring lytic transglycosylase RlpA family protein [Herminiimonas sp. KBW02]